MSLGVLTLVLRLLPSGPQKDAAAELVTVLESDPAGTKAILSHLARLPGLVGEVRAGKLDVATALTRWLDEYKTGPVSPAIRAAVDKLIDSVTANPKATNNALGPALPILASVMGKGRK